jgi:hypothetical protein
MKPCSSAIVLPVYCTKCTCTRHVHSWHGGFEANLHFPPENPDLIGQRKLDALFFSFLQNLYLHKYLFSWIKLIFLKNKIVFLLQERKLCNCTALSWIVQSPDPEIILRMILYVVPCSKAELGNLTLLTPVCLHLKENILYCKKSATPENMKNFLSQNIFYFLPASWTPVINLWLSNISANFRKK